MGVRLYFKFHRYMLPVCRSWNKLAGIWVFLLCQAYNTQRTYFPGDWLKPSMLCSILMMKYRFPIKRKSLPFRMLKMIRKREGGKKKKDSQLVKFRVLKEIQLADNPWPWAHNIFIWLCIGYIFIHFKPFPFSILFLGDRQTRINSSLGLHQMVWFT